MITNNKYNVDLASLSDTKKMYVFAKELYIDVKAPGKNSTAGRSSIKLLKSPGLLVSASGVSLSQKKTSFSKLLILSSDHNEFCDKFN